ncbi:MAG: hypothetical protein HKN21_07400, partial [Candidatus Eisenbacteria bacterium]|nr:hypothetical protein [Candidatus Eisenbacteria bacterium]
GGNNNTASQIYATVGGGQGNQATDDFTTVAGGKSNKAGTNFAFVGGGENNEAIAIYTTVSGGELNFARVPHTTIGGGKDNDARASFSTISGGESNQTSGVHATVPGGQANIASGDYSFAAGRNSIVTAIAPGSFVWSDASSSIGFTANSSNLFLIRATGGVGIGTENPSADLHVAGDIIADGTITKPSGVTLADHPLNPETQFLVHQEVSSSQMLNVYNGNAVLDGSGRAWVELPEWFEAYNKDFRYQLTCIGGHAPVFVASEVSGNRFQIAGGKSGMKVSWEITGVRNDAYAKTSTREVTPYKTPEQVGRYVTPEAFGAPASSALSASSGNE